MERRLLGGEPGMGQEPDTAGQITHYGHLLAIEQGHLAPAGLASGDGGREAGIEIAGHRKGDRHQLLRHQAIARHQGLH